jgi:hypothetical protein
VVGPRDLMFAVVVVILGATFATANDIYIAQNAQGANTGAGCANAYPVAFFNTASNWGTGAGQIGPGTTVHLCGTFTGTAGSTMLTVQGSGSNGNPVTLKFEAGADLKAPYWSGNGAVTCSGSNYITIDGNNTGIIENTANGDALTYQQSSKGMYFSNCSNVEVKNFTGGGAIRNLYQRNGSHSSNGRDTYAVFFDTGSDHFAVHDNTIKNSRNLIFVAYSTVTDAQIYNNTLDYSSWMIIAGDNNSNNHLSGYLVYNNTLGPHFDIWQDTAQTMHADGIMVFAANSGSSATAQIYNNYIHGDMCTSGGLNCTGYIYVQGNSNTNIFNNLIVAESGSNEGNIVIRGNSPGPAPSNNRVYNNTLVGSIGVKNGGGYAGTGLVIENNIFVSEAIGMTFGPNNLNSLSSANYNDFYSVTKVAADNVDSGPENDFTTLATWQGQGFDAGSTTGNPQLDVNYKPQSSSAAVNLATNLYPTCNGQTNPGLAALCLDKAGVVRPPSLRWDAGAYQDPPSVAPPTALSAAVH